MKVIKRADVGNWSYKFTCKECESELEADGKDLRHTKYDGDMREPGYEIFAVSCPVCNRATNIPSDKIPKLLQIEARERSERHNTNYFDR